MIQSEYLRELKESLEGRVSPEELNDILADYEGFFFSGREDGKTDDEISEELGSPAFLAKSLLEEHGRREDEPPGDKGRGDGCSAEDKHIANPGRRICAFIIDAAVAVVPILLVSIIAIRTLSLPYIMFLAYPSPGSGASIFIGYSAFAAFTVEKSDSVVETYTYRLGPDGQEEVLERKETVPGDKGKDTLPGSYVFVSAVIALVFYLLYPFACTVLFKGQTLGKRLMGIRLRRSNSSGVRPMDIFIREFLGKTIINSIPIVPIISFFTMLFTREHKALHDMLADTIVADV